MSIAESCEKPEKLERPVSSLVTSSVRRRSLSSFSSVSTSSINRSAPFPLILEKPEGKIRPSARIRADSNPGPGLRVEKVRCRVSRTAVPADDVEDGLLWDDVVVGSDKCVAIVDVDILRDEGIILEDANFGGGQSCASVSRCCKVKGLLLLLFISLTVLNT